MTQPTDPHTIGEALARLQREWTAAKTALDRQYLDRMADLHAQWIRARQMQRSVA